MKHIILLAFLFLAAPAAAKTFGASEFTLENGMSVVVIPNHRAPVITHMVWYKVGAADEEPGLSGMAHYLEHLLFKGTEKLEPGEFSKIVKTLGGNDNAFTGQDFTAYFQSIAVQNLPRVMEMEADRMLNANPPTEHYQSEKGVVLEERRQRTDNDPRALFGEQMQSLLFINHPYARPILGWMSEIEQYEWGDVKPFYDRWYAPNNAILILSGDITVEKAKALAQKYYGGLPRKEVPKRIRPALAPAPASTVLYMEDPAIHQPVFQRMYAAPAEAREKKYSLALTVLADIMAGGPTARLYKRLVAEQKKATSVSFDYSASALDYGRITLAATPVPGVTTKEIEERIDAEIKTLLENGVSAGEVRDSIQQLQDDAIFARDSVSGPAMIFGVALTTGSTVEDVENWPENIGKVSVDDVMAAARKYLDPENPWIRPPVSGHMNPAPQPAATGMKEQSHVER
jgi:zinc protease